MTSAALRDLVRSAPLSEARGALLRALLAEVAAFLHLPPDRVAQDTGFVALGFDSLRAVDFRTRLERLLGVELRSTLLFDQPDCVRLCDWLLSVLRPAAGVPTKVAPTATTHDGEPIAIVGMACRFPGECSDLDAFWRLLDDGREAIDEPPPGRWPMDELFDPDPAAPGRIYTRRGGFLPAIGDFDAAFFGISPVEATMLDPQQRLLLEVAWHTLEDAGVTPAQLHGDAPGVFVGMRASEYFQSQCARLPADSDAWYATGNAISTAAGRLSYFLGFRGPCFALDTACSGSLVAVHQAIRSLRSGECRAALAGGVNTLIDPLSSVGLCRARMLAPDGRCKTFDAAADGYVRAEGCGLVLLMREADALARGLRVHALIRGTAINQDGRTGGLTVPHGPSQEAVIRAALADARLTADDIDYVEAHGTGTSLGDPIEVQALDAVFAGRRAAGRPLLVGSVKTNIGHLEAAAGISGLLKAVLALQNGRLPAHRNLQRPNPHIDWTRTEIEVVTEGRAWPQRNGAPARAGVSSFGFSGTNAHVVLEAAASVPRALPTGRTQLLAVSAPNDAALTAQITRWATALETRRDDELADLAFTAGTGRQHFPQRAVVVADSVAAARMAFADGTGLLRGQAARTPPRVLFLCSGQGAQRAGAGRELLAEPAFADAIDRCARVFDRLRDVPLRDVLFGERQDLLTRTDYTQPALFSLQWALASLWRSVGVVPAAVIGHSVGEFAAAAIAGALEVEDGLRLCATRGALMVQHCLPGGMLAVFATAERAAAVLGELPPDCAFAVHNGPAEVVVAGPQPALRTLAERLAAAGLRSQPLQVSHAFHSPMLRPMLAPFERAARRILPRSPQVPWFSCKTAARASAVGVGSEHWVGHITEPVRFADAVQAAAADVDLLLEIGATPTLLGLVARLPGAPAGFPSLRPGVGDRRRWLTTAAELHVRGVPVDLGALAGTATRRVKAPGYAFTPRRFWLTMRGSAGREFVHPLLGNRLPVMALRDDQQLFAATVSEHAPAWCNDHRFGDRALLPAAAIVELALAAAATLPGDGPCTVRELAIAAPLWLSATPARVQVLLDGSASVAVPFRLAQVVDDRSFATQATAVLSRSAAPRPLVAANAGGENVDVATIYERYAQIGLHYGPAFRGIRALQRSEGAIIADVALPAEAGGDAGTFVIHPALLDACFQAAGLAAAAFGEASWLPIGIEQVRVWQRGVTGVRCLARARPQSDQQRSLVLDLSCLLGDQVAFAVDGLQLVRATAAQGDAAQRWWHGRTWERQARPTTTTAGTFTVVAPDPAATHELEQALAANGWQAAGGTTPGPTSLIHDARELPGEDAAAIAEALTALATSVRRAATTAPPAQLLLLTRNAQTADVVDPPPHLAGAALWGALRTIAQEHPDLRPRAVDTDDRTNLAALAAELQAPTPEDQVALRGDLRWCARLHAGAGAPDELTLPGGSWRLRCHEYGRLDSLRAEPVPQPTPGPGQVAIAVAAAGLNFKDVLYALGMLREFSEAQGITSAAAQPLGFECSGTITAIGAGVQGLQIGDAVVASTTDALASHVVAPADRTFALPPNVDLVAAAGLPTVFCTALLALEELATVGPQDTVLIHAVAGGVGLAALQVCRHRGARVIGTCSAGKAAFARHQGVTAWADSRGDFTTAVRSATGGHGVDVVLNCLTGEAIPRSLDLLRTGGRFVEIGKRSVWTTAQVAARRPDVRYHLFDLADLVQADPALVPRLLGKLRQGLAANQVRPVTTTCVPIARAAAGFAAMAQARHVGKIVLTLPAPVVIAADRTYVLTGGTGAVAQAIARQLVARGARHLALIARSATAADVPGIDGVTIRTFAADVGDRAQLAAALVAIRAAMPKVGGVVHAAGVLRDGLLQDLERAAALAVLRPKVDGLRHLTELLADDPTTFVLATTSMAGWLGNTGQTAYAAANAAVDAACSALTRRGRRAVAVAYGPWAEAGMAARMAAPATEALRARGVDAIAPEAGAAATLAALDRGGAEIALLPIRWATFLRQGGAQVPPFLRRLAAAQPPTTGAGPAIGTLAAELAALAPDARLAHLRQHLRAAFARLLGHPDPAQLDATRTFGELGIDSLLAVDMRTQLSRGLDLPLPATLLFDHPDLERLAAHLLRLLPAGAPATPTATTPVAPAAVPEDAEALAARLAEQIRAMEQRR
ncbi:MAG: SDR family NAD(P)-dependent oxidoreductase [Planctomycetes bacterium]|nr:SDR family NAD(P)-dependent oxidoreductase [Planctomycetota bacterium]